MSEEVSSFTCDACGECCRHIHLVEGLKHLQTDGICKYLDGNLCSIYSSRPDLCRYDKVYEMMKDNYSEKEFCEMSTEICNHLKSIKNHREER